MKTMFKLLLFMLVADFVIDAPKFPLAAHPTPRTNTSSATKTRSSLCAATEIVFGMMPNSQGNLVPGVYADVITGPKEEHTLVRSVVH